jgi:hypothetical protein
MIDHFYTVDLTKSNCHDSVFVWDGDAPYIGAPIGMNHETYERFLIDGAQWLHVRGDTIRVRAAA